MKSGSSDSSCLYGTSPTMTVHIPIKMSEEMITDATVAKAIGRAIGGLAS